MTKIIHAKKNEIEIFFLYPFVQLYMYGKYNIKITRKKCKICKLVSIFPMYCVVPEIIHTPPTEVLGISEGWGGQNPVNFQKGGGVSKEHVFRMVLRKKKPQKYCY